MTGEGDGQDGKLVAEEPKIATQRRMVRRSCTIPFGESALPVESVPLPLWGKLTVDLITRAAQPWPAVPERRGTRHWGTNSVVEEVDRGTGLAPGRGKD